jgi:hypothetical protein
LGGLVPQGEFMNIEKLAEIYKRGTKEAALVAEICDEVLDRSGALLGEVREAAQKSVQSDLLPCGHPESSLVQLCFGSLPYCEDCKRATSH